MAQRLITPEFELFVKTGPTDVLDSFALESTALLELCAAAGDSMVVPRPLGHGTTSDGRAFLCIEHLSLRPGRLAEFGALGRALAQLHRHQAPSQQHGWWRDNSIGASPQPNPWTADWAAFFVRHRLEWQFKLAAKSNRLFPRRQELLDHAGALLASHQPAASLLHGDLWSGNVGFVDPGGRPAIFDPACYYGDRETDIAFTSLFGGFPSEFYAAYEEEWPLPPGFQERALVYNLYHVLNHFNLFGSPYDGQAASLMDRLLEGRF